MNKYKKVDALMRNPSYKSLEEQFYSGVIDYQEFCFKVDRLEEFLGRREVLRLDGKVKLAISDS